MSTPKPPAGPEPWEPTRAHTREAWEATRLQTRLVRDEVAYLANGRENIGRAVGDNRHELFVTCDADLALRQQFEHLRPEFIAVHDVGTLSSPKLLAGIARASRRQVQELAIRRQGYGTPIATLPFVELPTSDGRTLRIYSTASQAEPGVREAVARTLLAHSTLGAVLVGDTPASALSGVFQPLHEEMLEGPWPNRHLLLLPLSTANALVAQGMELARDTGVNVLTTPQVTRPGDAWNFISTTWARVREPASAGSGTAPVPAPPAHPAAPPSFAAPPSSAAPAGAPAAAAPLPLRPMPLPGDRSHAPDVPEILHRYLEQLGRLTGMVSCCLFDVASGQPLLHAGARPGAEDLAEHGAELLACMLVVSRALGLGHGLPEAAITLGGHHLVLRPVPRHTGLALHAVLDKSHANLTLARLQIGRMDALFQETPPA